MDCKHESVVFVGLYSFIGSYKCKDCGTEICPVAYAIMKGWPNSYIGECDCEQCTKLLGVTRLTTKGSEATMEVDADKLMYDVIRDGFRDGIKSKLTASYNNPLEKLIEQSISKHGDSFRSILDAAISSCLKSEEFREDIAKSVRSNLAKTLVARFGGELEKQVNALKSDPTTRARITVAIDEIIRSK